MHIHVPLSIQETEKSCHVTMTIHCIQEVVWDKLCSRLLKHKLKLTFRSVIKPWPNTLTSCGKFEISDLKI